MIDTFTKSILTVIAIALCTLAIQNAVSSAEAYNHTSCGQFYKPCHVTLHDISQNASKHMQALLLATR